MGNGYQIGTLTAIFQEHFAITSNRQFTREIPMLLVCLLLAAVTAYRTLRAR